jgi:Uma2 family endonuclease
MATWPDTYITPEEYLARERAAETRSEYYQGQMFAREGVSLAHCLIVTNLLCELGNRLVGRDCHVLSSNMRILVSETGFCAYPDILVVCGQSVLLDEHGDVLLNPLILIEVLSDTSQEYDRGHKFHQYQRIRSLREYVTISQNNIQAEHSVRQPDESWLLREIAGKESTLSLSSVGIELKLIDIYDKVDIKR